MLADHTGDDIGSAIAARILRDAPPRFALAGLSMGGYIALEMVRQAPERVTQLALLDTNARPDTPEQSERRTRLIEMAERGQFSGIAELMIPAFLHKAHQQDPELRRIIKVMADETGPAAFVRQQRAIMTRPDSRPLLPAIRCPSLVLVGEGDELTPPALSQEIAAGIPGARLVAVPDCGHLSTLEQPDLVNTALLEWLAA
jgi:pimeloyl-ACP methyl ester carboxylesterase